MTRGDPVAAVAARLAAAGIASAQSEAEQLVRHVTGWSRSQIVTSRDAALSADAQRELSELVRRRALREPLQLLIGTVGFRHLELEVRPGVFIPRPETEVLAGCAIERVGVGGVVVEPCTGTGAIACSVAAESEAATVVATDTSADAVALAAANAERVGVAVTVLTGDLLDPVSAVLRGAVDVLVCNPPYLRPEELEVTEPEVRCWDPPAALVSGPTGHEVTDRLIAAAPLWLRPGGSLLLEVDATRAADTAHRAGAAGLVAVEVIADLTGAPRIVAARRPSVDSLA